MSFIVRMALREIRASWQRLVFFFVCIAIGVAAIVALRSVIQSVRTALSGEARALLSADLVVSGNDPFNRTVRASIAGEARAGRIVAQSEAIELPTMVRPADPAMTGSRIVELRAVQSSFPMYGTLRLPGGQPYTHDLLRGHGALVRPELLAQFGLAVGDRITIGAQPFQIRGVIESEPGRRLGSFSLGPRVLIDYADLDSTGLLSYGSRVDHQLLLKVPDAALAALTMDLRGAFANEFVGVRSYRRNEDRMSRDFERAENYLSLVGLVVLILGGIGVSSVARVFVQQKIRSIAVLKCIGARSTQIMGVYVLQVLALGLAGSMLGVVLARATLAAIPIALGGSTTILDAADYGL
jgi:putative ABC transport system permease protein